MKDIDPIKVIFTVLVFEVVVLFVYILAIIFTIS